MKHCGVAIALTFALASCGGSSRTEADRHIVEGSSGLFKPNGEFDEVSARDDAIADVGDLTFDDVGDTSQCTDDCEGHRAGFEWAKANTAGQPGACSGTSQSFIEGCEAFTGAVEKRVQDMRDEWEAGES
jgi:hypothetical protein